jgi:hypothetical protein
MVAAALLPAFSSAQGSGVLTVAPPAKATGKRNETLAVKIAVQLRSGYHVNSDKPADEYLIPLKLTWEPGSFQVLDVTFPKPKMERYEFSSKPLSVFTGDFEIVTRFKVLPAAHTGPSVLPGRLRYQACNNQMCLPPKSIEVRLPVDIQ